MQFKKYSLLSVFILVTTFSVFSWEGQPVTADPRDILDYPQSDWRDRRYEVFRWERFPSVLIFDTANYRVQNALFKRLAFFVEKLEFRGTLHANSEIADLHGWNAHDYRAEDLAAFFEEARRTRFLLNYEEGELARILVSAGIIRRNAAGQFIPGEGAIISISRESPDYLRHRFMVHEAFHAVFFIDEDFRNFSRRRFENLSPQAKAFILSYFELQKYDITDPYLVVNEFMAHVLQQASSNAGEYFGKTLASRIYATQFRTSLPSRDERSNSWPYLAKVFQTEAEAFSAYVNERWGFAAGRVWQRN